MSLVTDEIRAKAEMYSGDEICKEKSQELLRDLGLPNGLLPLHDIEECGYVKETGFVWLKQKNSITHKFEKIGKLVSYATEVTAVAEPNKIKELTGVKTKELLIWIRVSDIYIADPSSGKITFQTPAGLKRSFPVSAFQIEEKEKDVKDEDNKEVNEAVPVEDEKDTDNMEVNKAVPVKDVEDKDNKEMNEAVPVKDV